RRGPSRRRCARPRAQARPRAPQGAGCGDGGASQGDSLGLELSSELVAVRAALGVGEVLEAADLADRADVPLRRVGLGERIDVRMISAGQVTPRDAVRATCLRDNPWSVGAGVTARAANSRELDECCRAGGGDAGTHRDRCYARDEVADEERLD